MYVHHVRETFILVKVRTLFPQSYKCSLFYWKRFLSSFWEEGMLKLGYLSVFTRQLDINDKLNKQLC